MYESIDIATQEIENIIGANSPSMYLYGSVVLNDFRMGISDINILCITKTAISNSQAKQLISLKQTLVEEEIGNPYFKLLVIDFVSLDTCMGKTEDPVVHWGTDGACMMDSFRLDSYAIIELLEHGQLVYGGDIRYLMNYPEPSYLIEDTKLYLENTKQNSFAKKDAANTILHVLTKLHVLKTGMVASKSDAAIWAIAENVIPNSDVLKQLLEMRLQSLPIPQNKEVKNYLENYLDSFYDLLEQHANHSSIEHWYNED